MAYISIMQGRLCPPEDGRFQSFPRDEWESEFAAAAFAGLDGIEWIYDLYGADVNPLVDIKSCAKIATLGRENGVTVRSLCADYFMDRPILRTDDDGRATLRADLIKLLEQCSAVGIRRIVLPFVDISRIQSSADEDVLVAFIESAVPAAAEQKIEMHLETDLEPPRFAGLLARLESPFVKANYDSGNSASLGYRCDEELGAYGPRIGSVHIKDRVPGGATVPLGTGGADFPRLFEGLATLGYRGDFVLQAARGEAGSETALAAKNRQIVERLIAESGITE